MSTLITTSKTVNTTLALVTPVENANVFVPLLLLTLKPVTKKVFTFLGDTKVFVQCNATVAENTLHVFPLVH
jgi:hypothetical protein